jgi:hypothetical protein
LKKQRILQERVRRVKVLFRELGYETLDDELSEDAFTAGFQREKEGRGSEGEERARQRGGARGGFFIDRESRFLEIGYTFSFSPSMSEFLKHRLEDMLKIAYEYGCYSNILSGQAEIVFSVFTKIYFSGLNYYSLKDSLYDFRHCVDTITEVLDLDAEESGEEP